MVIARGREDAKDVLYLLFGVLLAGDGGDLGEGDLVAELGLVLVAVDGEQIGTEDDVNRLPLLQGVSRQGRGERRARDGGSYLGLASALHDGASLDEAVELEAAVLVDGRHGAAVGPVRSEGFEP